ncbi:YtxH domain-containing protein [Brevibacterium sp. CFH 10365]|uniref:YtxH domain-containing protein n=1 Tax=Brevibacterium sp. CFH 10365 TaxID=2585207 RepID=UPI00126665C6|nr:YtxH domain-containing protein [Brevibacterium sp. CFH 10365]
MKKRLILLAGLGVGFILGSRTGRQSYERLKAQAQDLWTDPRVQDTVEKANQSIREKSPAVADAVQTAADKVNAAAATNAPVSEFDGDEDSAAAKAAGGADKHASSPKARDSIADPERHLDDEGPAGVADDD